MYPIAVNKGFKKIYSGSKKRRTNVASRERYSYHAVDGFVTRSVNRSQPAENGEGFRNGTIVQRNSINFGELDVNNKSSFYLGLHIIRDGDRKQRFYKSGDPFIEYYNLNKSDFDAYGINIDRSIIACGCFKTNKNTLQQTMIPEISSIMKFAIKCIIAYVISAAVSVAIFVFEGK